MTNLESPFLTIQEAALYLRVSVSTLYGWIHQRVIPFRKHGRRVLFNKAELEIWSKGRKTNSYAN